MHNDTKCTVPLVVQHSANVKISWGCFFQNVNIFSISHCWNWNLWVWTVGLIKHDIFQTPWKMFPILPSDISYKKRSESAALLSVTMTWLTTTVWILFSSGVGDTTGGTGRSPRFRTLNQKFGVDSSRETHISSEQLLHSKLSSVSASLETLNILGFY